MKIFNSIKDFFSTNQTAITIGMFDGVHLGHQKVLEQLIHKAKQNNLKSVVITFEPHPRHFFINDDESLSLLNTLDEKIDLLQNTHIDYLIIQKFDKEFAVQLPESFLIKLTNQLKMKNLLMGYDHKFGKNRTGDYQFFKSLEKKYHYEVDKINVLKINKQNISSSLIRTLLLEGKIKKANDLLGYNYSFSGSVVQGNQLGRTIGFSTANIEVDNHQKLIPKQGVYLVKSTIDNQLIYGMMNIGFRPTILGKHQTKEVHFFDFNADLYDKKIKVSFIQRIRNEQKFSSLNELKNQLKKDEFFSRQLIKKL